MKEHRPPLIIHHRGCSDGICGALVLWLYCSKNAEVMDAQYGDPPPTDEQVSGRKVYIVDFSYPKETLIHLNEVASSLKVFDHHKTAQENCAGLSFCAFDQSRSGARIAYDFVEPSLLRCKGVDEDLKDRLDHLTQYVQDRDLWKWRLPHSRKVSLWLASYPRTIVSWFATLQSFPHASVRGPEDYDEILSAAQVLKRQIERDLDSLSQGARLARVKLVTLSGETKVRTAAVVNSPLLQSELGERLLQSYDVDMAVIFFISKDGYYIYSLRSNRDDVDVSVLAKAFDGGGHPKSSGFKTLIPPNAIFIWEEGDQ